MNTQNLTKTNIIDFAKAELIEKELGIELNGVYNYNIPIEARINIIQPYDDLYSICRKFKKGIRHDSDKTNKFIMDIQNE
jgi:hypothetical protein